jgi:hypothetical protein
MAALAGPLNPVYPKSFHQRDPAVDAALISTRSAAAKEKLLQQQQQQSSTGGVASDAGTKASSTTTPVPLDTVLNEEGSNTRSALQVKDGGSFGVGGSVLVLLHEDSEEAAVKAAGFRQLHWT